MLKRIKEITGVGCIKNLTSCAGIEFKKIIILFGYNGYGKTVLANILQSINDNDAEAVKRMKTIPSQDGQKINFSFYNDEGRAEQQVTFENGGWNNNFQNGKIFVFDNDFIHKNLIAGVKIERENKEGFSEFIFGEDSVRKAKEIEEQNRSLGEKKKDLKKQSLFANGEDEEKIDQFINLKVTEKKKELEETLSIKKKEMENMNKTSEIQSLPDLNVVKRENVLKDDDIKSMVRDLNNVLARDYIFVTKETLNRIDKHIEHNMKDDKEMSRTWVADGVTHYSNGKHCPFCGQKIDVVKDLMDAYNSAFNQEYEKFIKEVGGSLDRLKSEIEQFDFVGISSLASITQNISKYRKYNKDVNTDNVNVKGIESAEQKLNKYFKEEKERIVQLINKKENTPHIEMEQLSLSDCFLNNLEEARDDIFEKVGVLNRIIEEATKMKEKYTSPPETINDGVRRIKAEIESAERKIKRLEQNDECERYKAEKKEIDNLGENIKKETDELKEKQSNDVQKYFEKLNENYKTLGNRDFSLSQEMDRRGHTPVYKIVVKLNGDELSDDQIPRTMSDSEKRSLAFAVFLTKLHFVKNKDKKIVVFDDPVVSFDTNRIKNTSSLLSKIGNDFGQLIFMTHYKPFVKELCEVFSHKAERKVLELTKKNDSTTLEEKDEGKFTQSRIEETFEKLQDFADSKTNEDASLMLRPYIETRLKICFQEEIRKQNIQNTNGLGDLINKLANAKIINEEQNQRLKSFNSLARGNHHNLHEHENRENNRNFVNEVLDFFRQEFCCRHGER